MEIRKHLELNNNKNTRHQELQNSADVMIRSKFIVLNYIRKQNKILEINKLQNTKINLTKQKKGNNDI